MVPNRRNRDPPSFWPRGSVEKIMLGQPLHGAVGYDGATWLGAAGPATPARDELCRILLGSSRCRYVHQIRLSHRSAEPKCGRSRLSTKSFLQRSAIGWTRTNLFRSCRGPKSFAWTAPSSEWKIDLELDEVPVPEACASIRQSQIFKRCILPPTPRASFPSRRILLAAYKRGIGLDVFARIAGNGPSAWSRMVIPGEEMAARGTQARRFSCTMTPRLG